MIIQSSGLTLSLLISFVDFNIFIIIDKIGAINTSLKKLLLKFHYQKIVVLGDLMVDRYLWSSVDQISPEAPVPVAKIEKETIVPGGAANTAFNLASMGAKVEVVGTVGNDIFGQQLIDLMIAKNIGVSGVVIDPSQPTTLKTRIMSGNYQLIRFDVEDTGAVSLKTEKQLIKNVDKNLIGSKILIISDYSKGLISVNMAKHCLVSAKKIGIKTLVDPTRQSFLKYKQAYLIKPNKKEAETITGKIIFSDYSNLKEIGWKIIKKLQTEIACITLGKDGMALFDNRNRYFRIPTTDREVFDVSGAGDTTIAALAVSLSSGATLRQAAIIANYAAGIVVGKLGTATCNLQELETRLG